MRPRVFGDRVRRDARGLLAAARGAGRGGGGRDGGGRGLSVEQQRRADAPDPDDIVVHVRRFAPSWKASAATMAAHPPHYFYEV